jgi:hypothetical protein
MTGDRARQEEKEDESAHSADNYCKRDADSLPFRCISSCPRRIEHQSLCWATGIPHSTQTRTRFFGGSLLLPNKRFNSDMPPPGWM